jgi:hypothetical protein
MRRKRLAICLRQQGSDNEYGEGNSKAACVGREIGYR